MNRQYDLLVGFTCSLLLHGILLFCVACTWPVFDSGVIPDFQTGESSLALTLISSPLQPQEQAALSKPESSRPVYTDPMPVESEPVFIETEQDAIEQPAEIEMASHFPDNSAIFPEKVIHANADMLTKGVVGEPRAESKIRPYYPLGSRMRGEEGTVIVRITVNAFGKAQRIDITKSSEYRALNRAAINAVRRARVIPARKNGTALEAETTLTFRFELID